MSVFPAGNRGKGDSRQEHEARLAGLYEEYYDRIARYAYVHIGDRPDAEDLAGDVFLKALQSLGSYEERGIPMQAWLFRIAHNMVVDYLRKKTKVKSVPIDSVTLPATDDPTRLAEHNIEMARVSQAMQQLTPDQRAVVGLRFFAGLSSKEVGDLLQKSDGAVREMQRAGLEKLRRLLNTGGETA
jgi:RNA polymerase sigma-70 factor (ECF subfamily)